MLTMLSAIEPQFRRSTQQQLLVEMLLVRFALLDRSVSLEEVLQTLGGSRPQGVATASASSAPARSRPLQTESRAAPRPPAAAAPQRADVPAEAVRTPPTPPLRVTPAAPQAPVDWKAELEQTANSTSRPARLTTEAVREERLRMLRAQDPVLDAAVRELDLDLKD